MEDKELKYLLFQLEEIKDTLRLTGNIYNARTEETAYSRGFVRSEKYIKEVIEKVSQLSNEEELAPVMKAEYDEMVKSGEIESEKEEKKCNQIYNLHNNRCINCGAKQGYPCELTPSKK